MNLLSPYVNGPENGRVMWMMIDPAEMLLKGDVSIHVSTVMVEPGENYSFGEEVITKRENVDLGRIQMDSTGEGATILKPCEILVSGLCREDGFNLYHVICGTPEEIDQELEREKVPQTLAELASDGDIHTVPLTVINELGKTIKVLNFAQPSAETWGNNPLSDSPLESGTSGTIKFNFNRESLIWDIRVILDDEDSWTFNGNDFSGADPEKGIILRFYWNDQGGMSVKYS